jgi:hypothetical protein
MSIIHTVGTVLDRIARKARQSVEAGIVSTTTLQAGFIGATTQTVRNPCRTSQALVVIKESVWYTLSTGNIASCIVNGPAQLTI